MAEAAVGGLKDQGEASWTTESLTMEVKGAALDQSEPKQQQVRAMVCSTPETVGRSSDEEESSDGEAQMIDSSSRSRNKNVLMLQVICKDLGMTDRVYWTHCLYCQKERVEKEEALRKKKEREEREWEQWRQNQPALKFFGQMIPPAVWRQHEVAKLKHKIEQKEAPFHDRNKKTEAKSKQLAKNAAPCLICGTPCCKRHSSNRFRGEGILVCCDCQQLFELHQFVTDLLVSATTAANVKDDLLLCMMHTYRRALQLLQRVAPLSDLLCHALQQLTARQNQLTVASSASGVVSGALGVAAAVTLLTPVGAPLLVTSLVFAGGSTAITASSHAVHHQDAMTQLANRVVCLYGILQSIVQATSTLRRVLLRDVTQQRDNNVLYNQAAVFKATDIMLVLNAKSVSDKMKSKDCGPACEDDEEDLMAPAGSWHAGLLSAMTLGRCSMACVDTAVETAVTGTAGATATAAAASTATSTAAAAAQADAAVVAASTTAATTATRAGTEALQLVNVAQVAGGALSAATLVLETAVLTATIQAIRNGNPSAKADLVQHILELDQLPSPAQLQRECDQYLTILSQRREPLTAEHARKLLAECAQNNSRKAAPVVAPPVKKMQEDTNVDAAVASDQVDHAASIMEEVELAASTSSDNCKNKNGFGMWWDGVLRGLSKENEAQQQHKDELVVQFSNAEEPSVSELDLEGDFADDHPAILPAHVLAVASETTAAQPTLDLVHDDKENDSSSVDDSSQSILKPMFLRPFTTVHTH